MESQSEEYEMTPTTEQRASEPIDNLPVPAEQNFASCRICGSFLAPDQRYCLACGELTGEGADARERFVGVQPGLPAAPDPHKTTPTTLITNPAALMAESQAPVAHGTTERRYMAIGAAGAALFCLTVIAAGAVGAGLNDGGAPAPQPIIQAAAAAPTAATGPTAVAFTSDWPADKNGWTIQLKEFDKTVAQPAEVAAFKQEATGKGLEAGALETDGFSSLTPGFWIVYAGQFDSEKAAKKALKDAKSKGFSEAQVVEVTNEEQAISANDKDAVDDTKLKNLDKLPPEEQAKERAKLPDETKIPGKPPPKDDKPAGGGSDEVTIGSLQRDRPPSKGGIR